MNANAGVEEFCDSALTARQYGPHQLYLSCSSFSYMILAEDCGCKPLRYDPSIRQLGNGTRK